jgi:hypothetical protein
MKRSDGQTRKGENESKLRKVYMDEYCMEVGATGVDFYF